MSYHVAILPYRLDTGYVGVPSLTVEPTFLSSHRTAKAALRKLGHVISKSRRYALPPCYGAWYVCILPNGNTVSRNELARMIERELV